MIQAFDQLHTAYEESNDRLFELRGHRTLFDVDRRILQDNLFGVDLNEAAVEICRLSLWIKTAARGKKLTSLDQTIRVGNSVVDDPDVLSESALSRVLLTGRQTINGPEERRGRMNGMNSKIQSTTGVSSKSRRRFGLTLRNCRDSHGTNPGSL